MMFASNPNAGFRFLNDENSAPPLFVTVERPFIERSRLVFGLDTNTRTAPSRGWALCFSPASLPRKSDSNQSEDLRMPIIRTKNKTDENSCWIPIAMLEDKRLSLRAKGIMSYILSLKPGEAYDLRVEGNCGKHAIATALKQLKKYGYLDQHAGLSRKAYQKGRIPDEIRWEVLERDNFTCLHCGSRRFLTVDHIIPESSGGTLETDNLQTLCRSCNSKKGNKSR